MNKRLIIVIFTGILILAVIGGLLFMAVQKQKKPPVAAVPQIKKILDEPVISPVLSFDSNAIWYFNSEGRLFRINIDGSGLSEFPLPSLASGNLTRAIWPKTGSDFVATAGSGLNEIKSYYNSAQKIYTNLASNIQSIDWLPDSRRVVYIWKSSDNLHQQLVVADADGTGFRAIKDVFWPDLTVKAGPDGKTALLYRSIPPGDVNKVYSANLDTGEIGTIVEQGKTIGAVWIDNNRFVFAQSSITAYPKLYLYDLTNRQAVDLSLNTALDKITFDQAGKFLYAAVPKNDNTGDIFIKEDLTSFKQETYFSAEGGSASGGELNVRANTLLVAGNNLYFINTGDQKFYMISK